MLRGLNNLRPYSWVDLFLLGFLAKFSVTGTLSFEVLDAFMVLGLFLLWCSLNLVLELRHSYSYRAKPGFGMPLLCLLLAALIGYLHSPYSSVFAFLSAFFIAMYLLKNLSKAFGNLSPVFRGLIQAAFFFYALAFYTSEIACLHAALGLAIVLIYAARGIVGDVRDAKHNKEAGKRTLVVDYGVVPSIACALMLLLTSVAILALFSSVLVGIPLIMFSILLWAYRNGYVLHQSSIITTSFTSVNLITHFTGNILVFTNLVFTGLLLNMAFYPLLKRKSNPGFKQCLV